VKISSRRAVIVVVCTLFSAWVGMTFAQSWQHRQVEMLFENEKIRTVLMNTFPNEDRPDLERRVNRLITEKMSFMSAVRVYQGELEISRILKQDEISNEDARKLDYERETVSSDRYFIAFERYAQALRKAGISMTETLPLDVASKAVMDTNGGSMAIELALELAGKDAFDSAKITASTWFDYVPQRDIAAALLIINSGDFRVSRSISDLLEYPVGEFLIQRELAEIHAALERRERVRIGIRDDEDFKEFMMECMFRVMDFEDKQKLVDMADRIFQMDVASREAKMPDGSPMTKFDIATMMLLSSGKADVEYPDPAAKAAGQERLLLFVTNFGFLDGCAAESTSFRRGSRE